VKSFVLLAYLPAILASNPNVQSYDESTLSCKTLLTTTSHHGPVPTYTSTTIENLQPWTVTVTIHPTTTSVPHTVTSTATSTTTVTTTTTDLLVTDTFTSTSTFYVTDTFTDSSTSTDTETDTATVTSTSTTTAAAPAGFISASNSALPLPSVKKRNDKQGGDACSPKEPEQCDINKQNYPQQVDCRLTRSQLSQAP
jgi:hypothetical protein